MTPSSKQYFTNLGIDVEFNTLGATPELISEFIANTQSLVSIESYQMSEHIKHTCYSQFYSFTARPKLTGFENFKTADRQFRICQNPLVKTPQVRHCNITDKTASSNNYKSVLVNYLQSYTKPIILYLSGGLDSELLANALIEAGKSFTPVIFKWTDGVTTQNDAEFQYALDFCSLHGLTPVIQTFNINELWASEEFKQLSLDMQLVSSHLTTHGYMVKHMNSLMPNCQHLFGGEVRYRTNYLKDDSTLANIILLGKVAPSYGNFIYDFISTTIHNGSSLSLSFSSSGTWNINAIGTNLGGGESFSGTWAEAPLAAGGYQYRISAISGGAAGPSSFISPSSAPTAWTTISSNTVCSANAPDSGINSDNSASAEFFIEIRPTAFPAQVMMSSVNFNVSEL